MMSREKGAVKADRQSPDGSVLLARIVGMSAAHTWHTMRVHGIVSWSKSECALSLPRSPFMRSNWIRPF
jgi:hypothetical protein